MSEILCAIASWRPTGLPHCTRAPAQRRTMPRQTLTVPTEMLGIESRPSLSVVSAIFRPLPSRPIRLPAGIRTSSNVITAFASARSPMKWQRRSTRTPGQSVSTTKALIRRVRGSTAITTSSFASVPFVVQSLVPLSR